MPKLRIDSVNVHYGDEGEKPCLKVTLTAPDPEMPDDGIVVLVTTEFDLSKNLFTLEREAIEFASLTYGLQSEPDRLVS